MLLERLLNTFFLLLRQAESSVGFFTSVNTRATALLTSSMRRRKLFASSRRPSWRNNFIISSFLLKTEGEEGKVKLKSEIN